MPHQCFIKAVFKCVSVPWNKLFSKLAVIRSHPAVFNQNFLSLTVGNSEGKVYAEYIPSTQAHTYTVPTPSQNVDFYFDLCCKSVKLGQL